MGDQHFQVTLRAVNLAPVTRGWLGGPRTNPMYKISAFQMGQAEPFYVVYESEVVEASLNPSWKKSSTSEALFGDPELPVMISVLDKQGTIETPIGTIETSLSDIKRRAVGDTDEVDSSKVFQLKDAAGKEVGMIVVVEAKIADPEDEPDPEPEPEPAAVAPPLQSSTSLASTATEDSTSPRRPSSTGQMLELAKMQQMLKDLGRRTDKLEKETHDLRHENKDLKDRVKYLENSLKQDRKLMEMAQTEIGQLKQKNIVALVNGIPHGDVTHHAPKVNPPSILDGDLITSTKEEMDDKSHKSASKSRHHHSRNSPDKSTPKKGSDHKSTSTIDSDEKSSSKQRSHVNAHRTPDKKTDRHTPHRRGSATSLASKNSTSPSVRSTRSREKDGKSGHSRSMRKARTTDKETSSSSPRRKSEASPRRAGSVKRDTKMDSKSEKHRSPRR